MTRIFLRSPLSILIQLLFTAALAVAPTNGDVMISEVMASNDRSLEDEDGDSPDWIELFNAGDESVDLEGFSLTDDQASPSKWQIPSGVVLEPDAFLVLFASGKDRTHADGELHTNFTIDADAPYVGLYDSNGTALSEYDLRDVPQFEDVSYGVEQSGATTTTTVLASSRPALMLVPTLDIGLSWVQPEFEDRLWNSVTTGIGYERSSGYESLIGNGGNVEEEMYQTNGSVYLRVPFEVSDASRIVQLTLRMKYDDGFAAFLNGVRVADANAPQNLRWDSTSTGQHDDSAAVVFDDLDITAGARHLVEGENILAIQGLNTNLDSSDLIIMPEVRLSQLNDATVGERGYLSRATPGTFNSESFNGFVADTRFSVDRGFFSEPFEVELTTETEEAQIRYTLDGSDPTASSGEEYEGPLTIGETTVLRAAAFKDGLVPSNIDTQTYLFLDDVVTQQRDHQAPDGWPDNGEVNGHEMRYGMSPAIVDDDRDAVIEALRSVPTFSIATPRENLFDPARGIYVNPGNDGRNWERPMSFELIHPDGTEGFQVDGGIRIRGGFSRSSGNPKHAFRLFFRGEYGDTKLRYPLFGDDGTDTFDNIDLRTTQNYSWAFQGDDRNLYLRDVFSRDLQGMMGHPHTRSRFYHLYINGIYWGLFQTQERAEASFAESYLGGDKEDYDVVSKFGSTTDGNRDAYRELWEHATAGFTSNSRYYRAQGLNPDGTPNSEYPRLLDVDNVIDYMILTYYTGDRDGPGSRFTQPNPNNYFGIYNRVNPDGFKFFEHDSEHSMDVGENNMVSPFTSGSSASQFNPHWLHEQLMENAEYRERFVDRVQETLFNGGLLTPENASALINRRAAQIESAMLAESARWGWVGRTTNPYDLDDWRNALQDCLNWIESRNDTLIGQLQAVDWFPDVTAPEFSVPGGAVPAGFSLGFISGAGTLYFTTDGSDPRTSGGNVSPSAMVAEPAREIATRLLDEGSRATAFVPDSSALGSSWRNGGFDDSAWASGTAGIGYDENTTYDPYIDIDVGEVAGTNGSVYVRVPFQFDASEVSELRLSMRYDDGFVAYLNGTRVAASNAPASPTWNSTATANNDDSNAQTFESFDISEHIGSLIEGSNVLAIHGLNTSTTSSDMLISPRLESITSTGGSDNVLPDGLITVAARVREGNDWSALSTARFQVGISPATAENTAITELMYHPAEPTEAELTAGFLDQDQFEFVEIRNTSSGRIDLSDARFTEGITFTFPLGTLLEPGAMVIIASDAAAFGLRHRRSALGSYTGNLANSGERIRLESADGETIADFSYNDRGNWPRLPDGDGYSLTLRSGSMDYSLADSWRSSASFGGSPDATDSQSLANWKSSHFSQAQLADASVSGDLADPDGDGLTNLMEYATGFQPLVHDASSSTWIEAEQADDGQSGIRITLRRASAADDVMTSIEASFNLTAWFPLEPEQLDLDGETRNAEDPPGVVRLRWELGSAPIIDPSVFFRVRVKRVENE